jgi:uncharacterized membrane protein
MTGRLNLPMKTALIAASAANLALLLFYNSRLPGRVAVHFDFAGNANGWMDKGENLFAGIAMTVVITVIFLLIPLVIRAAPEKYLNTPKKDFWLRPENRERFSALVGGQMCVAGILMNLFFAVVFYRVYRFNMGDAGAMKGLLPYAVVPLLAGILGSILYLVFSLNKGDRR